MKPLVIFILDSPQTLVFLSGQRGEVKPTAARQAPGNYLVTVVCVGAGIEGLMGSNSRNQKNKTAFIPYRLRPVAV
jgi:hypothetical protein